MLWGNGSHVRNPALFACDQLHEYRGRDNADIAIRAQRKQAAVISHDDVGLRRDRSLHYAVVRVVGNNRQT